MKKIIFTLLFLGLFSEVSAGSFVYPFDQVASPKCRFSDWSSLGSDCKMTLPRIAGADYNKYKDDKNLRKVYSILWGSTYNFGWDVGYGSHLGVDIATSEGTPVRSIGDGEVLVAGWVNGWGNTVVIKHKLSDGRYIYSDYAHMSKITTTKGAIKAGTNIGEVGNTGNSYGNHLHFQIDITNQSHPYWYSTCSKGVDIMDVVNNGQCRDFLLTNTIDPILFLESNGTFTSIENIQERQTKTIKIEQKNIKSREQILDEEIDEFLKEHTFDFQTNVASDNLEIGKTYITKLVVYYRGQPFDGNLPGKGIEFNFDRAGMRVFPENAIIIEKGSREIQLTGLQNTVQTLSLKLGKKLIFSKQINFFKAGDFSNPTDAFIMTKNQNATIGNEMMGAVIFKTKYGNRQLYVPYDGTYVIKAISGKVKFCNISNKRSKKCDSNELTYELGFNYNDTKYGVMIFNMVALDYSPIKLVVKRVGRKYDIASQNSNMLVNNPLRLDTNYIYFQESIEILKKGILRLKDGYLLQDKELIGADMKELLKNSLMYEYLKSGDNLARKKIITDKTKNFSNYILQLDDYKKITRGEFAKILFDNLGLSLAPNAKELLYDEKGQYKDYMISLRVNYSFKWKDQYAENYFQPDKNLTIGEALYMIYKISPYIKF